MANKADSMQDSISMLFYKSWKTGLEMIRDRQYIVPDDLFDVSYEVAVERYMSRHPSAAVQSEFQSKEGGRIALHMPHEAGLDKSKIREYMRYLADKDISNGIFIGSKIPAFWQRNARYCDAEYPNIEVEIFDQKELACNPTKHEFVPRHRILSPREAEEVLKKYICKLDNLPCILATDKIARYYGARPGQIMAIYRLDAKTPYYRAVI